MVKLTQYGCPPEYGCPSCNIRNKKWSTIKWHMRRCCPEYFDLYDDADLRNHYCSLSAERSIVPGHEEWQEEKRKAIEERIAQEQREIDGLNGMPKWNKHDEKFQGGTYNRTTNITLSEASQGFLRSLIEEIFNKNPDPYGVQEAMGSKEDWIHWGLKLAESPSKTRVVFTEHQTDIRLHIKDLTKLDKKIEDGYTGSFPYIQALHCIFQDTFIRCELPSPPLLNMEHAIKLRSDGSDSKGRMRSFHGYQMRAFEIIRTVKNNIEKMPDAQQDDLEPFQAKPLLHRQPVQTLFFQSISCP